MISSLSDSSQQHTVHHFYFHVIFISAYSAVRVKTYAYVTILGRNDLITALTRIENVTKFLGRATVYLRICFVMCLWQEVGDMQHALC